MREQWHEKKNLKLIDWADWVLMGQLCLSEAMSAFIY